MVNGVAVLFLCELGLISAEQLKDDLQLVNQHLNCAKDTLPQNIDYENYYFFFNSYIIFIRCSTFGQTLASAALYHTSFISLFRRQSVDLMRFGDPLEMLSLQLPFKLY